MNKKPQILLVDDEDRPLNSFSNLLSVQDKTFTADSAQTALQILDKEKSVEVVRTAICQVLLNLLENSHEAVRLKDGKWIKMEILDKSDHIQISISNNGDNIPLDLQDKIFEIFYSTKNSNIGGAGLGLSVCKKIIENHHGKISLDNNSTHTKFDITIEKEKTKEQAKEQAKAKVS